jgi:hypothetical protein
MKFYLLLTWFGCCTAFLPNIKTKVDTTHLPHRHQNIIRKINGFYGVVGPSIKEYKNESLYEAFQSNGNVQGLFLKNGNITFVRHNIETDKKSLKVFLGISLKRHYTIC